MFEHLQLNRSCPSIVCNTDVPADPARENSLHASQEQCGGARMVGIGHRSMVVRLTATLAG